ncbi:Hypothetical predicted protein, partial [Olea europaea subsp. europaea]
ADPVHGASPRRRVRPLLPGFDRAGGAADRLSAGRQRELGASVAAVAAVAASEWSGATHVMSHDVRVRHGVTLRPLWEYPLRYIASVKIITEAIPGMGSFLGYQNLREVLKDRSGSGCEGVAAPGVGPGTAYVLHRNIHGLSDRR